MKIINFKGWPANRDQRRIPLTWLPYFGFYILQPIVDHASRRVWLLDGIGGVFFLIFFFGMFWDRGPRQWYHLGGIFLLGLLLAPINGGAATFFIYASAFVPFL